MSENESVKKRLVQAAKNVYYQDNCGGRACRYFERVLMMYAEAVDGLTKLGFQVEFDFKPGLWGYAKIDLVKGENRQQIVYLFFETYTAGWDLMYIQYYPTPDFDVALSEEISHLKQLLETLAFAS